MIVSIFLVFIPFSTALQEHLCVTAELTDISPTSIKIGDEFTVGVLIDNCGSDVPEDIVFELKDVSPHISVKESLRKDIGKIGYSNSDRFILYHMKVSEDAVPGEYAFKYELNYGQESFEVEKEGNFSVTVIGDRSELGVASVKTSPVLPVEGETVELTMRVENAGDGTAKSIKVYMEHPFRGVRQSFIGTLAPDEDGPAVFTFIADKSGEYTFPAVISYKDDFGESEIKTDISISVLEEKSNFGVIIFGVILAGVFGGGIFYFVKVKRSKDRIIHRLLNGNGNKSKK